MRGKSDYAKLTDVIKLRYVVLFFLSFRSEMLTVLHITSSDFSMLTLAFSVGSVSYTTVTPAISGC